METVHRKLIASKSEKLFELINLDLLMSYIMSEKLFTIPMLEDIYDEPNDKLRKKKFFEELPTRGPKAFNNFVKILKIAGQKEAVLLLEENKAGYSSSNENGQTQSSPVHNRRNSVNIIDEQTLVVQGGDIKSAEEPKSIEDIYVTESVPRGCCLIINNVDFNGFAELRLGSDLDAERLDKLFQYLGYNVFLRRNLTGTEMRNLLHDFSKRRDHKGVDSSVVIILSHGSTGCVHGIDLEKVYINDILEHFDNANCENLIGKPKLFFIQACRGENYDSGAMKTESTDSLNLTPQTSPQVDDKRVPILTDMLISYSTIEGYISIRDHHLGSWYCQSLCKVLKEYASKHDLHTMLRMVDREVKKFVSSSGEKQATEINLKGWDKRFYFNVPRVI